MFHDDHVPPYWATDVAALAEPVIDPSYEFNAPKFVDLGLLDRGSDEEIDSWFDHMHLDHEMYTKQSPRSLLKPKSTRKPRLMPQPAPGTPPCPRAGVHQQMVPPDSTVPRSKKLKTDEASTHLPSSAAQQMAATDDLTTVQPQGASGPAAQPLPALTPDTPAQPVPLQRAQQGAPPFEQLPVDVRDRIASMIFDEFSMALHSARTQSTAAFLRQAVLPVKDIPYRVSLHCTNPSCQCFYSWCDSSLRRNEAQVIISAGSAKHPDFVARGTSYCSLCGHSATWSHQMERPGPNMVPIRNTLLQLSTWCTLGRYWRETFRPYYIAAVFQSFVRDSTVLIADDAETKLLQGVTVDGKDRSIETCASEIDHLVSLVTCPSKVRFTGGTRGLFTIPVAGRHSYGISTEYPGFITHSHAASIFGINREEFVALAVKDGQSQDSQPRFQHVRECAAAALLKIGSFQSLAKKKKHLIQKSDTTTRVEWVLQAVADLHISTAADPLIERLKSILSVAEQNMKIDKKGCLLSHRNDDHFLTACLGLLKPYILGEYDKEVKAATQAEAALTSIEVKNLEHELERRRKHTESSRTPFDFFSSDPAIQRALKGARMFAPQHVLKSQWGNMNSSVKAKYEQLAEAHNNQLDVDSYTDTDSQSDTVSADPHLYRFSVACPGCCGANDCEVHIEDSHWQVESCETKTSHYDYWTSSNFVTKDYKMVVFVAVRCSCDGCEHVLHVKCCCQSNFAEDRAMVKYTQRQVHSSTVTQVDNQWKLKYSPMTGGETYNFVNCETGDKQVFPPPFRWVATADIAPHEEVRFISPKSAAEITMPANHPYTRRQGYDAAVNVADFHRRIVNEVLHRQKNVKLIFPDGCPANTAHQVSMFPQPRLITTESLLISGTLVEMDPRAVLKCEIQKLANLKRQGLITREARYQCIVEKLQRDQMFAAKLLPDSSPDCLNWSIMQQMASEFRYAPALRLILDFVRSGDAAEHALQAVDGVIARTLSIQTTLTDCFLPQCKSLIPFSEGAISFIGNCSDSAQQVSEVTAVEALQGTLELERSILAQFNKRVQSEYQKHRLQFLDTTFCKRVQKQKAEPFRCLSLNKLLNARLAEIDTAQMEREIALQDRACALEAREKSEREKARLKRDRALVGTARGATHDASQADQGPVGESESAAKKARQNFMAKFSQTKKSKR